MHRCWCRESDRAFARPRCLWLFPTRRQRFGCQAILAPCRRVRPENADGDRVRLVRDTHEGRADLATDFMPSTARVNAVGGVATWATEFDGKIHGGVWQEAKYEAGPKTVTNRKAARCKENFNRTAHEELQTTGCYATTGPPCFHEVDGIAGHASTSFATLPYRRSAQFS